MAASTRDLSPPCTEVIDESEDNSTALDPSEAKYWYDRAYIVPGKTTFYKFNQESISSIV